MGRSLKKAIYVLTPFVVYYLVHGITRFLMMFLLQLLSSYSTGIYSVIKAHDALFSGIISLLDMSIGAIALIFLMKRDFEELSIWDYVNLNGISFYRSDRIHSYAFGWILIAVQAVSMAIGLNVLIGLSGLMKISSYEDSAQAQYSIPIWLGLVLYGLVSPAVEELLFRTVIYGRMKRRFAVILSMIMSSLFFGLYHGNLVQGIYGFIMGFLMCMACEYLHTVTGAFLMHSAANITIYLLGMSGLLLKLSTPLFCCVFIAIGLITIACEAGFSYKTYKTMGHIEGIAPVGCFYRDPTLFEDEEDIYT
ncbi:MAG: CPBP family intramembrane metalloprotease [Lachnospiraceae bacterium]|nr:CPBP family intramembrane metalloprotease [Lachnospiraceae bacterium]